MNTRKQFLNNIFIDDLTRRSVGYRYNKRIINFINEIKTIDSIFDYEAFSEKIKSIPKTLLGTSYTIKRAYAENSLYGYADQLMSYAGLNEEPMIFLPLLEHGIDLRDGVYDDGHMDNVSYIMQGWRNCKELYMMRKKTCYCIGPYIHYSSCYYSHEKTEEIRKKYGKVLLVFPPHTTEYGDEAHILDDFYSNVLNRVGKNYDTIMACVFWTDIEKDYIKRISSSGAILVSAGFKLDSNFVKRLKTIIQISDTVLYPAFTTSIGYAFYLGKNIICYAYDAGTHDNNSNVFIKQYNDLFCSVFSIENDRSYEDKYSLIDRYWGLSNLKEKDEIRKIYFDNKAEIIRRLGF